MTSASLLVSNTVLWALVIALSVVVLALARQVTLLHGRITPVGALMLMKGLAVGEPAPVIAAEDLDGRAVRIGGQRDDVRSLLVMFVSPTCPVCKQLLPVLKGSRRDERDWLEIVLASDGDLPSQRTFVAAQGLQSFPYVVSAELGRTYQVNRLPFAALIDPDGTLRARGIINSREHLESLFEAKRLGVASVQEYLESRANPKAA